MQRVIPIILTLTLLAACEGKFILRNTPNSCGSEGYTFVVIHYGDGRLITLPIIEVAAGAELQYRLLPGNDSALIDYSAANVAITPKTAPSPPYPTPPADATWLNASGSVDLNGDVWKVCVPQNPTGSTYYYTITVDGVGQLDPRADVEF